MFSIDCSLVSMATFTVSRTELLVKMLMQENVFFTLQLLQLKTPVYFWKESLLTLFAVNSDTSCCINDSKKSGGYV